MSAGRAYSGGMPPCRLRPTIAFNQIWSSERKRGAEAPLDLKLHVVGATIRPTHPARSCGAARERHRPRKALLLRLRQLPPAHGAGVAPDSLPRRRPDAVHVQAARGGSSRLHPRQEHAPRGLHQRSCRCRIPWPREPPREQVLPVLAQTHQQPAHCRSWEPDLRQARNCHPSLGHAALGYARPLAVVAGRSRSGGAVRAAVDRGADAHAASSLRSCSLRLWSCRL